MSDEQTAYEQLEDHFGRLDRLRQAASILHWDREAMMPQGAADSRAEQLTTLSLLAHEMVVDPQVGEWLDAVDEGPLDTWQHANLREMRKNYLHATSVPGSLVEARSRATAACHVAWRTAKAEDDFGALEPKLADVVKVSRDIATAKAEALGLDPYDALLDNFAPGWTSEKIDVIFDELADFLPGLIDEVIDAQAQQESPLKPEGPFERAKQEALAREFMSALGFDFERGRLDESAHAFCGGAADDIRITINYLEDDFARSIMAVLHETGHALYEMGLPKKWRYQPVGKARGMSIHESQSILVEMQVCRSREFFDFAAPMLSQAFDGQGDAWSPENLFRLGTRVRRSFIRIDADEVTYPAHVILRYRLEQAMIRGELEVADLPEAWNAAMDELIGVVPEGDRDGCMQDIHWIEGLFGYFPTYTLGALAAAQLFQSADSEIDGLSSSIARGDFDALIGWLGEKIHSRGSLVSSDQLIRDATGSPLSAEAYRSHIQSRYLS